MTGLIARARPLLLIVLAIAVGVAFATWQANRASAKGAPRFAATEISDGVLFNEGPAAQYLTALNRGPTPWTEETRATQQRINRAIAADPKWADAFAARMQSGDPRQVMAAMADLGQLARRVLDEQYGSSKIDELVMQIDRDWVEEKLIKGAVLHNEFAFDNGHEVWFALDVVVAAEVAVVAIVAAVIVAVVGFGTPDAVLSAKTLLAKEILVQDIAAGLQVGY